MNAVLNTGRLSPTEQVPMALAAAGTTWVATFAWRGFTEVSLRYLMPLLFLGLVVAGVGLALRAARLGPLSVLAGQVVLSGMALSLVLCSSPLPIGSAWDRLVQNLADSVATAQQYAAPVPGTSHGVQALLIVAGWGCLVLVDHLACTLRRVPLAGLPVLMIYSLPVGLIGGSIGWLGFSLSAGGYLTMLFLHQQERVVRWGRTLGDDMDSQAFGVSTGAIRTTAGTMGMAATALALFVPLLLPSFGLTFLGIGPGTGRGGDQINIENPMTDLHRDLVRGDDTPLVRFSTSDPDPSYLRIATLVNFSNEEWSTGDRSVPITQRAQGPMPRLFGVRADVPRKVYPYDVTILPAFRSLWLPSQPNLQRIDAPGDWRYDRSTMDFLAGDPTLNAAGERYSFEAIDLDLDAADLSIAPGGAAQVSNKFLQLPDNLPSEVRNLANQVTRNATTSYGRAVALQNWFRKDGGFRYTLNVTARTSTSDLLTFLTDSRRGYCEQFASAMGAMLRTLGIPSRVAVGFLDPERVGKGLYQYSSDDLHAWPEAYFPGSGWVRFEPTPGDRATTVPAYTTQDLPPATGLPTQGAEKSNDVAPRGESSSPKPSAEPRHDQSANAAKADAGIFGWPILVATGLLVLLLVVALVPRAVRRSRATSRLGGGIELAWAEVRDTAVDLGVGWPTGRTPREVAGHLRTRFGAPGTSPDARPARGADLAPEASAALGRLVGRLERSRYARPGGGPGAEAGTREDALLVCGALGDGATRAARRRAEWWPTSLWRRTGPVPDDVETPLGPEGVVDRVGAVRA